MTRSRPTDEEAAVEVSSPIEPPLEPPLDEPPTTNVVEPPASMDEGQGQDQVVEDQPIQETEEASEPPEGHVAVVYSGIADLIEHGDLKFRPGQPVYVPSDQVDELLTWPNEPFALVAPAPADEE